LRGVAEADAGLELEAGADLPMDLGHPADEVGVGKPLDVLLGTDDHLRVGRPAQGEVEEEAAVGFAVDVTLACRPCPVFPPSFMATVP